MFHRNQINLRNLVVIVLSTAVAACSGGGGGGSGGGGGNNPPPVVSDPLSVFGSAFATAFNASANSEPVSVGEEDIIPISLTAEPIEIIWN